MLVSTDKKKPETSFETIDMNGLLEKYKDANIFSLTGPFFNEHHIEFPHGIYLVNKNPEIIVKRWTGRVFKSAQRIYEKFDVTDKNKLPEFSGLFKEMTEEIAELSDDLFMLNKTRYTEPKGLSEIYQELIKQKKRSSELLKQDLYSKIKNIFDVFDDSYYAQLKDSIYKIEITNRWHCTIGNISAVYYFKINDKSILWLRNLKDDYALVLLEDLAFYKDSELLFSSCTHEHFHNDIKKRDNS